MRDMKFLFPPCLLVLMFLGMFLSFPCGVTPQGSFLFTQIFSKKPIDKQQHACYNTSTKRDDLPNL